MKDLKHLHGRKFTANIIEIPVEGKICIDDYVYLCQDIMEGDRPSNIQLFGYRYSWGLECIDDPEVNSVTNLKILSMTKEEIEDYKDFKEGDVLCKKGSDTLKKVDAVLNNIVFTIDQDELKYSTHYSKQELYNKGWRLKMEPEEVSLPIVELTLEEIAKLKGISVEQLRIKE